MSRPAKNPNTLKSEIGNYTLRILEVNKERVVVEEHIQKDIKVRKHVLDDTTFKPSELETLTFLFGTIHQAKSQRPHSTGLFSLNFITCRGLKKSFLDNLQQILDLGYRYEMNSLTSFTLKVAPEDHRVWSDIPFNV